MKNSLKYLLLVMAIMMCSLCGSAAQPAKNDTLYFYDTWDQMLELSPVAFVENPRFYVANPHEIYLETGDEKLDRKLMKEHIAISLGDSVWLVSSYYIRNNFEGDVRNLEGYIPVFFNDKAAYITQPGKVSVRDVLFATAEDYDYSSNSFYYYNIDFLKREVKKMTPANLSALLESYHDLQMRYEGMKDYKKDEIIEDYYFKYIERMTQDIMRPYIVDLVETSKQ